MGGKIAKAAGWLTAISSFRGARLTGLAAVRLRLSEKDCVRCVLLCESPSLTTPSLSPLPSAPSPTSCWAVDTAVQEFSLNKHEADILRFHRRTACMHPLGFTLTQAFCSDVLFRAWQHKFSTRCGHRLRAFEKQQHSSSCSQAESMDAIFTALLTRSFWSQSQLWWLVVNLNVRSELLWFQFSVRRVWTRVWTKGSVSIMGTETSGDNTNSQHFHKASNSLLIRHLCSKGHVHLRHGNTTHTTRLDKRWGAGGFPDWCLSMNEHELCRERRTLP